MSATIKHILGLLEMNLHIPEYQRPYKWTRKNVTELLNDIERALLDGASAYRIGTVILHDAGEPGEGGAGSNRLYIVDGQQRLITLVLVWHHLQRTEAERVSLFEQPAFLDETTRNNITKNHRVIKEWFKDCKTNENEFRTALENTVEAVVITVDNLDEAFQLFDSQNTRGKDLYPHDLLKAYHLRAIANQCDKVDGDPWESAEDGDLHELFDSYLFNIENWSRRQRTWRFTKKDIDRYKGAPCPGGGDRNRNDPEPYPYAVRAETASPFQIGRPFIEGRDFFDMTTYYLELKKKVEDRLESDEFSDFKDVLDTSRKTTGYGYAKHLFECAAMKYYDRFGSLDKRTARKLAEWAFYPRIKKQKLDFNSIDKYAIGDGDGDNELPLFEIIEHARVHTEIAELELEHFDGKLEGRLTLAERNQLRRNLNLLLDRGEN